MEKVLLATYKNGTNLQGRRTRTYLRKMARYIEHAWEIGFRDGVSGKPLIPWKDLQTAQAADDSPMERDMYRRAYAAYSSGHRAGTKERGE